MKFYILRGETFIFSYQEEQRQNEVQLFEKKEDVDWVRRILQPFISEKLVIQEWEIPENSIN